MILYFFWTRDWFPPVWYNSNFPFRYFHYQYYNDKNIRLNLFLHRNSHMNFLQEFYDKTQNSAMILILGCRYGNRLIAEGAKVNVDHCTTCLCQVCFTFPRISFTHLYDWDLFALAQRLDGLNTSVTMFNWESFMCAH